MSRKTKYGFSLSLLCLLGALTACAARPAGRTAPESVPAPSAASASTMDLAAEEVPAAQTLEKTDVDLLTVTIPEGLADACVNCGGEVAVRPLGENEVGPVEEDCISCIHGTDAVYTCVQTYQLVCQNPDCDSPYKSEPWSVSSPGRRICYGW